MDKELLYLKMINTLKDSIKTQVRPTLLIKSIKDIFSYIHIKMALTDYSNRSNYLFLTNTINIKARKSDIKSLISLTNIFEELQLITESKNRKKTMFIEDLVKYTKRFHNNSIYTFQEIVPYSYISKYLFNYLNGQNIELEFKDIPSSDIKFNNLIIDFGEIFDLEKYSNIISRDTSNKIINNTVKTCLSTAKKAFINSTHSL